MEDKNKIVEVDIEKQMKEAYLDYAMSVIVSRALPDVRDGLKPVHRRIIFGMHELGLTADKPFRKSAKLVGDVMGKFHPHGDSAIYDAVVRLAQDFSTRYPLADGQGNFGSIDGDGAAAMRYTEVRMTRLTQEMLRDIGKNTVDFKPNFDDSEKEPEVLPARFPNLLVNGSSGIAVGMATNMAPHNLGEVIDGTVAYIDNPEIELDGIMKYIKGPDFPTGAHIMGKEGIKKAYATGRGKLIIRAVADIEEYKNRYRIVISEIPYQVNKSSLIEKMANLVKEKRVEGISDIRDESGRNGLRIVVELKTSANPNVILNQLYKYTPLQSSFGIINLALVGGQPRILGLKDLISNYVDHQKNVVTRRTQFELDKAEARAHIVEGLLIALDHIDEIIKIIRENYDEGTIKKIFKERFSLTEEQGAAILSMQLRRLSGLEREKLDQEYEELIKTIARLKEILSNNTLLMNIIKEELLEIKEKYADSRRTKIKPAIGEFDAEELIEEEDVVITLTNQGYIKRMPEATYKPQRRGGRGITALTTKEDDFVKDMFITSTHDNVLFFTNKGKVFSMKAYEIPEGGRQAKGTAIINLIQIGTDEFVNAVIPIKEFDDSSALMMITRRGTIKKTTLDQFENIRKSGIIAINLNEDDELISVRKTEEGSDVILVSRDGLAIRFNQSDVRPMGRTATGVKGMNLSPDDEIIGMDIADDDKFLLVISENGYGKRTSIKEYITQHRGGKGVKTYKIAKKTGDLAAAVVINEDDEVMIINSDSIIIRIGAADISSLGRATSGVKLMDIKNDSIVCAVAKYISD